MIKKNIVGVIILLSLTGSLFSQSFTNEDISKLVARYKSDARGPYKDIRWFCVDGTTVTPDLRCSEPGAVQRARYKDEVISLANKKNVFLGQILSTTLFPDFWDVQNFNSRLKQYQLEKYLRSVDNGWVLRKAQHYRGAFQAEDEDAWGLEFFNWLLAGDSTLTTNFFIIREAVKSIPHNENSNLVQDIRAVSKTIAEIYPAFMNIRVKIHGQPEQTDLGNVVAFQKSHLTKLPAEAKPMFDKLISDMEKYYKPISLEDLRKQLKPVPSASEIHKSISQFITANNSKTSGLNFLRETSDVIFSIRKNMLTVKSPKARLALLDISIKLEGILFKEINNLPSDNLSQVLEKNYLLAKTITGCGFLELWEWESVSEKLKPSPNNNYTLDELNVYLTNTRRVLEWGTSMATSTFQNVVNLYLPFEPLVKSFNDDQIRSTLLLPLGTSFNALFGFFNRESNLTNNVFNESDVGSVRGLNPGYAKGKLVVVTEDAENMDFASDKIYFLNRPPADLKPVAGIATVSEGNLVSHVQLLARNLAIPNSVISSELLEKLKSYAGREVFYAVSPKGTIILKEASQMNKVEKELFAKKSRSDERINVPTDKINLSETGIISLGKLRATDSGRTCGPKAANLGELKFLFKDNVVEGLVIPFGVFKKHMDQQMPGMEISYWQFLEQTFSETQENGSLPNTQKSNDEYILARLDELRTAIKNMRLLPDFMSELDSKFPEILSQPLGNVPVFIRSDTNMEDLKDFTGAGLNLTLFNVVTKENILQGIKDVWASPYSERSYKWRQKYLLNPVNVYPSLLIIPSVNVEKSGVMITKGITTGNKDDITIAFSKGAGGAVEGQMAETYLIPRDGEVDLISPSREFTYNDLPVTGGTTKKTASLNNPLLSKAELESLKKFASVIIEKLPKQNAGESSALDIELGFANNQIWLFQVRPFVENKKALSSSYLESITPKIPGEKLINANAKL